jgi:exopolysaccharide production protein ExoZ
MAGAKRTEIQWLRALAATEVALAHSDLVTKHFSDYRLVSEWWYQPLGGAGVELFFILSGYVICMRIQTYSTGGAFMLSRIRRLFPLYAIFTTLVLLTYFINPAWRLNNFQLSLTSIAQSYLILPQWKSPILGVGWTLEHEMVFYWLVGLVMLGWSMQSRARPAIAWILTAMGFLGCLQGPEPGYGLWPFHIFSPYMFAFGFGWLLCCVEEMGVPARTASLAIFAAIGIVAYTAGTEFGDRLLFRIALMALIFYGFIASRRMFESDNLMNRLAVKAGDASFSIYLSHWFVLSAIGKLLGALDPPAYTADFLRGLGILTSIAIGVWLFQVLERPVDLWFRGDRSVDVPWLRFIPRLSFDRAGIGDGAPTPKPPLRDVG